MKSPISLSDLADNGIRYIRFEFADLHGIARSKKVPISAATNFWAKGLHVYGGSFGLDTASEVVPETGVNEEKRYADMLLIPDTETLFQLPHKPDTAAVICDIYDHAGALMPYAPRTILRQQLADVEAMGYHALMAHEFEFYLYEKSTLSPLFEGLHIFNTLCNEAHPVLDAILSALLEAGIPVLTHNAEYSGSQFEITYAPAVGLAAADRAYRFKSIVKEVADQHGFIASFMSKPSTDKAGSGCHLHLSLLHHHNQQNAFWDTEQPQRLSMLAQHFIAGTLAHAHALTAFACPTINCYHRLKPHTFAPSNISWGIEDRSAMVRAKNHSENAAHLELRLASAMTNPYLLATGWLTAGLSGIAQAQTPPPPSQQPAEDEPQWSPLLTQLPDALSALEHNNAFFEALPSSFLKLYLSVKRHELARFHAHVSDWERNEYLRLY